MAVKKRISLVVYMLVLCLLLGPPALAQEDDAGEEAAKPAAAEPKAAAKLDEGELAKNWVELMHFIKIARIDAARSYGQAILESGAPAREIYLESERVEGSQATLERGRRLEGMGKIVGDLIKKIDQGYQEERRAPDQIERSIRLLGGRELEFKRGRDRIRRSGEYSLPQLIQKLVDSKTSDSLKERILTVLPTLELQGVRGLSVALKTKNTQVQEALANTLGQIGYAHAAPRLKELAEQKGILTRTREVTLAALKTCYQGAENKAVAELYYELALKYYYQAESIAPDLRYPRANVWYWDEGKGLTYKVVPREIFCDVYAMRMARLALSHDRTFYPAVSLWLAAKLRKEINLPEGETDPTEAEGAAPAEYYALAAGATFLQRVLDRALNDGDSALARMAIQALAQTTGAKSLVKPVAGGAQPLVQALTYPDQRVRFLAALSLATALPEKRFTGDELVMMVLQRALSVMAPKRALLMAEDAERLNDLKAALREAGYEVIEQTDVVKAIKHVREAGGVDVVVLSDAAGAAEVLVKIRRDASLTLLPVVIAAERTEELGELVKKDGRTAIGGEDAAAAVEAATKAVQIDRKEAMTEEEAAQWAIMAAEAVRLVGMTGNRVLKVSAVLAQLTETLKDRHAALQTAAAGALAVIRDAQAQRSIASLACDTKIDQAVRIDAFGSLGESLRRFGNQLSDDLAEAVVNVVTGQEAEEIRLAAAKALGAMSLPSGKMKSLILGVPGEKQS